MVPGKDSPFCPHDSGSAIPREGRDLRGTVDSSFSDLALGLVTFGKEQWLQMANLVDLVLFWLLTINTPLGTG